METPEMIDRKSHRLASFRERGMTLIELMIVMVVVGILVAIAYPSYQSQVQQTRRADGKSALLTAAQELERCFTRFNSYNDAGCTVAADIADGGMPSRDGWYVVTNTSGTPATTYTLVATPQNGQADDTKCANLTLTQSGLRGATGTSTARCW
jgi:type IV pilus assembly protein PilE